MDDRNGLGPQGGYIAKITNDAREGEMEENMGQVNTMIGNLRNMAIDMGSELENQNRQIDRINRKVSGRSENRADVIASSPGGTWHGSKFTDRRSSKPASSLSRRHTVTVRSWSEVRDVLRKNRIVTVALRL